MIYILLPAYNEEDALRPLAAKLDRVMRDMGSPYRIVVVNDGSKDRTADILRDLVAEYPVDVITHRYNRGLGETARDGFEFIAEVAAPDDVVVRMDCDDTHDPAYIPSMVARLAEGYEVVIASRYAPGGGAMGLDWYRRTISRCANLLFKTAFPLTGVWEYSCGFRAYRASVLKDAMAIFGNKFIDLKGLGFTGTLEKLIKFRMMGARVAEIPFVLRYDQKLSVSKVVTSITTLGCFILIVKHSRYWAGEPLRWKAAIDERKRRVYSRPLASLPDAPRASAWLARRHETAPTAIGNGRPGIDAVRAFWDGNPLWAGESAHAPGAREFFEEHERVALYEHSGALDRIFVDGVAPGRRVLDVGCGNGFWTTQFSARGATISACDLSDAAVSLTRQRLALASLSAEVRQGNAEELPFADESFDHVNCQGVIHHTPDTHRCIEEFHRVLKPGGTVCFSVYYRGALLRSKLLFRAATAVARPFVRLRGRGREGMLAVDSPEELVRLYDGAGNPIGKAYTRDELEAMVAGRFRVLEVRRFGFPRRVFPFPLPSVLHRGLSRAFGLMIALRCERLETRDSGLGTRDSADLERASSSHLVDEPASPKSRVPNPEATLASR